MLVAEDAADGILGFGTGGPARTFSPPYQGEIYMLYVLPGFQDLGIGRALMQGLFERLLRRRFRSGLLWVLADNPARFFYQTVGGKLIGRREEPIWARYSKAGWLVALPLVVLYYGHQVTCRQWDVCLF